MSARVGSSREAEPRAELHGGGSVADALRQVSRVFDPHGDRSPFVPAVPMDCLGDAQFRADFGLKYAYVAGAMANGIASVELVEAVSRAGMLAFFGSAGLDPARVESAIDRLQRDLGKRPWGVNLIHSPNEPELENAIVDLLIRRNVHLVEASAYMELTLPVVRYRVHGIRRSPDGTIVTPNRILAKVSRVEVASKFFSPPPEKFLRTLVDTGVITAEQFEIAEQIPMAQDLTAEADSAGHTDNRPALALLPTLFALRDRQQKQLGFAQRLRVGAGGGIATPAAAVAAFSMGAAYIMTGSINQACVESGSSDLVRKMLAEAQQADCAMAPAADMFEMGVRVQVLKRGTMFPMRAAKLFELYRQYPSLEAIPESERAALEKNTFRATLNEVWLQTESYFRTRDAAQIQRAERDPKHKMALVFRSYLGQSSRWANAGEPSRQMDYQVWCGPAMGAFNEWTKGSFLERVENRRVADVALNILYGAAVLTRAHILRLQNVEIPAELLACAPLAVAEIERLSKPV